MYVSICLSKEYVGLFKTNGMDGDLLWATCYSDGDTGDADLKDMGVGNGLHRRKIIRKFKAYLRELLDESPA